MKKSHTAIISPTPANEIWIKFGKFGGQTNCLWISFSSFALTCPVHSFLEHKAGDSLWKYLITDRDSAMFNKECNEEVQPEGFNVVSTWDFQVQKGFEEWEKILQSLLFWNFETHCVSIYKTCVIWALCGQFSCIISTLIFLKQTAKALIQRGKMFPLIMTLF